MNNRARHTEEPESELSRENFTACSTFSFCWSVYSCHCISIYKQRLFIHLVYKSAEEDTAQGHGAGGKACGSESKHCPDSSKNTTQTAWQEGSTTIPGRHAAGLSVTLPVRLFPFSEHRCTCRRLRASRLQPQMYISEKVHEYEEI